jgi:hypothetical protein
MNLTLPNQFPEHAPNSWEAVHFWSQNSARFQHASLACQVMAGFALNELHKHYRITPGNPRPETGRGRTPDQFTNDSLIDRQNTWSDLVQQHAGVSHDTARNWMRMAKGITARWANLPIKDRLRALISTPASDWQEADTKLISDAVQKATDGLTQMEFMWELGIAKKAGPRRGRKPGDGAGTTRPTPPIDEAKSDNDNEDILIELRHTMRLFTDPGDDFLRGCSTECLRVLSQECEALAQRIKAILAKRAAIAPAPRAARNPRT